MPTYLDHHGMPEVSPEMSEGIAEQIRSGARDEHGVKGLNVYLADGEAYCVSDAPSAEAVMEAHAKMGLQLRREDVVEVTAVP